MDPLSSGELLLKELLKGMIINEDWLEVKKKISERLLPFTQRARTDISEIDNLTKDLRYQLFLEVAGPELRELWGSDAEASFKPELLREPYLPANKRTDLLGVVSTFCAEKIEKILSDATMQPTYRRYFVSTKLRVQHLLEHRRDVVPPHHLREELGTSLAALLRREGLITRLLATPLTPQSAYDSRKDDSMGDLYKFSTFVPLTVESQGALAVKDVLEGFDEAKVHKLCVHLRGILLDVSVRTNIWGFCYLSRSATEPPNPRALNAVRELSRLTADKGFDVSNSRGLEHSAIYAMVSAAVDAGIAAALPLSTSKMRGVTYEGTDSRPNSAQATPAWLRRSEAAVTELGHLSSRARFMVHAAYALNDEFDSRVVMISVLLLWVFPREPPTSEKMLRIYQRIVLECLPSLQLHHEYSLATVAHGAWALLLQRDPELTYRLQNFELTKAPRRKPRRDESDADSTARSRATDRPNVDDDDNAGLVLDEDKTKNASAPGMSNTAMGPQALEVPRSLLLLRGWLEDGFMGWLGENTVLYIWDQLTLFGANPATFRELLPIICVVLMCCMREELMKVPQGSDLVVALREIGRKLRTRNMVEALRCEPLCAHFAPPRPSNPVTLGWQEDTADDPLLNTAISALSMGTARGLDDEPDDIAYPITAVPNIVEAQSGKDPSALALDLTGLSTHVLSRTGSIAPSPTGSVRE